MKKAIIASIILVLLLTLTSCGSNKDSANTSNPPVKASTNTKQSIESIDSVMESVETSVDSLEDAVDINIDNLE